MKLKLPFLLLALILGSTTYAQLDLELELFADGFNSPVDLQNAGDDRLFVVEQGGRIKILNSNGTTNATPFLNLAGQVSTGSEQGLLGLAFHPDYANNGYFYVNYTLPNDDTRISRFSVNPGDPDLALPGSELILMEIFQPFTNHNGGCVAFGDDGYLYISTGDGGSGGDPGNRAQNTTLLLGKILRIDVDNPAAPLNYGIPTDNPFFNDPPNAPEIWAYGLRNPWKFSFDSDNADIWIGDVGQFDVEEIDTAGSTEGGLNYGWRCYEGSQPFNTSGCPPPGQLVFPIAEYSSATGSGNCSITGGYVYRGSMFPQMQGHYFAADVCSGRIYTVNDQGDLTNHNSFGGSWVSFGEDVNNELYIVDLGGEIHQVKNIPLIGFEDFDISSVRLVPNPASDVLTVSVEGQLLNAISMIDINGRLVMEKSGLETSNEVISLASVPSGFYFVKIVTALGNSVTKKLVVQ